MAKKKLLITVCGCGPGALEYLTPAARQAIQNAEVLVGARRLLSLVPGRRAERIAVGAGIEKALDEIAARRCRRIAVLVTGDTGLCSFAQPVLKRFGREACELIPGISSVQVAFARLGLDWMDARILSTHHDTPTLDLRALGKHEKVAVLLGRKDSLIWVAKLARRLGKRYRVFVCENLTLRDERVREVAASELPKLTVSSLALAILVKKGLFT